MKKSLFLFLLTVNISAFAQFEPNYDESKIPEYTLPEILLSNSNMEITNVKDWENIRRLEILNIFKDEMYGNIPQANVNISYETIESNDNVLDGIASRKQVKIIFSSDNQKLSADLLIYLPVKKDKPVPLFIGYNFCGNHSIHPDNNILITESWVRNNSIVDIFDNKSKSQSVKL